MKIPSEITAGNSVSWIDCAARDNLGGEITSADWSLVYNFRSSVSLNVSAVAEGSGWKTTLTTANTTFLTAGVHYWSAKATKASDVVTLGSGQLKVNPDLSAATTPFDGRSQARKDLDAVQAAIRAMATGGGVQEYTIGNRSIRKMAITDLIALESRLKAEVVREEKAATIANGQGNPNNLFVRFRR